MDLDTQLAQGLAELDLGVDEDLRQRLLAYLDELLAWNRAYNLTAVRDPRDMVILHLLDSLSILPWVCGKALLDVGTGAGLPGIPLALAQPRRCYTLLDSNGKKVRFLRHVIRRLGLDQVEAVQSRVESYRGDAPFDCVTARAFSAVESLLEAVRHLLAPGARVLAMRGRLEETPELPTGYRLMEARPLAVPGLDAQRHLLVIEYES